MKKDYSIYYCESCLAMFSEECCCDQEEEDEYDESDELERFDCTCGAWRYNDKTGNFIHSADCICGSSEPFGK